MTIQEYADYLYNKFHDYTETAEQYEFVKLVIYNALIQRKRKECSDVEFIHEMKQVLNEFGIKYEEQ